MGQVDLHVDVLAPLDAHELQQASLAGTQVAGSPPVLVAPASRGVEPPSRAEAPASNASPQSGSHVHPGSQANERSHAQPSFPESKTTEASEDRRAPPLADRGSSQPKRGRSVRRSSDEVRMNEPTLPARPEAAKRGARRWALAVSAMEPEARVATRDAPRGRGYVCPDVN